MVVVVVSANTMLRHIGGLRFNVITLILRPRRKERAGSILESKLDNERII